MKILNKLKFEEYLNLIQGLLFYHKISHNLIYFDHEYLNYEFVY